MPKADAVHQLGISRTILYKLIDQGKVSTTPDALIDQAELV
jgi:ACT domain-containing protein